MDKVGSTPGRGPAACFHLSLLLLLLTIFVFSACQALVQQLDFSRERPHTVLESFFHSWDPETAVGENDEPGGDTRLFARRAGWVEDEGEHSNNNNNESKQAAATAGSSCPASCFRPNPVCGVDGRTYWCGATDAECAGTQVEYVGYCDVGSRGAGSKGLLAVQSLLLVHMIWLMLAGLLVLLGIP